MFFFFGKLVKVEANGRGQKPVILEWFEKNPTVKATPHDVKKYVLPDTPITSIRRAMTDLTDGGQLTKSSYRRMTGKGVVNHTWSLSEN